MTCCRRESPWLRRAMLPRGSHVICGALACAKLTDLAVHSRLANVTWHWHQFVRDQMPVIMQSLIKHLRCTELQHKYSLLSEMCTVHSIHLDLHIRVWSALQFQCAVALHLIPVAPVHHKAAYSNCIVKQMLRQRCKLDKV